MCKRIGVVLLALFISSYLSAREREEAVCGVFQEPFLFWLWSSMAGTPDKGEVQNIKFIKPSEFITSDSKTLRGYKYISNNGDKTVPARGYLLVAMGNAMISDRMIKELKSFSLMNYDVYVYDYRGYANSDGNRRINAIIEDYKEMVSALNKSYDRKLLYGISLGGAIMLNVIGSGAEYDRAVIDSAPSFLSPYGCPKRIDPVANLPKNAANILVITGERDAILSKSMTAPLRESAMERGAKTFDGENFAHPFNDGNPKIHNQRMKLILNHLNSD